MSELLPCPFCGGEAEIKQTEYGWFYPACTNWSCSCNWCEAYKTEAEAVEAWNTRAWTVADNDAEIPGDVTEGLFRDLMKSDPDTARIWARSWPELFGKVVGE